MRAGARTRKQVAAATALPIVTLVFVGCAADVGDSSTTESIGSVEQALVEGERCGAGYGTCNIGLTCCWEFWQHSFCRDLDWDEDNCGACGHECYSTDLCLDGVCNYFGK